MRKIIRVCILLIFVICVVIGLSIKNYINKGNNKIISNDVDLNDETKQYFESRFNLYNLTEEEKEQIIDWEVYGAHELIRLMCLKNGDWSKLPISEETRNKYNEKEGILKDYEFKNVEVDYEGVEYFDASPAKVIITNGKEKKRVYVDYRFTDEGINYINIKDVITIVDKNGNKQNEGFPFDEKHILMNFETWKNVGLTDKYISNHGKELLNLFIHYSPLDYNPIGFDIKKSRLEDNMAYFTVTSFLECKEREYEVYYTLDKNYYLDDVDVKCVKEVELEPTNKYETEKLIYKNSNWQGLKLSNKYMKKFSSNDGVIKDKNIIYYEFYIIKTNEYILKIQLQNGNIEYYCDKEKYDKDGYLDDMQIEKLPYENMSIEEVKELYLKDLENNK